MNDELYLIAHKVRGAPAFDIATHLTCPLCNATNDHCTACDGVGHWWIVPTSGHRAYPYAYWEFCDLMVGDTIDGYISINAVLPEIPIGLRDHYTTETEAAFSLTHALGLDKPTTPPTPILRRF